MPRRAGWYTCPVACSTLSSDGAAESRLAHDEAGYQYGGARALVTLHEHHLREFLDIWRRAQAAEVSLPADGGDAYQSLETLLHHVLRAARGYLVWLCRNLQLDDPSVGRPPDPDEVAAKADEYVAHLIDRYATPLRDVPPERFGDQTYRFSRAQTTVEGLLEHAVMHPIRHSFQLRNLLSAQAR